MRSASQVSGDPRRPDEVVRYKKPAKSPDEGGGDLMLVVAVVIGAASLMFKVLSAIDS